MPSFEQKITITYWLTLTSIIILGIIAYLNNSVFFTDALISITVISIIFHLRKKLLFSWEGAALCCTGWLMNMAGAIGAYNLSFSGLGWDKLLHFTSILGLTLLTFAYLKQKDASFSALEIGIIVFLIAQGFGAINEVAEFIGSEYFNIGQGLFGMMNGLSEPVTVFDMYDTHWDMIINTIAVGIGLTIAWAQHRTTTVKLKERTVA